MKSGRSRPFHCRPIRTWSAMRRSEEHTSELQSQSNLVCRLLLEKKKTPVLFGGLNLNDVRQTVAHRETPPLVFTITPSRDASLHCGTVATIITFMHTLNWNTDAF